MKFDRNHKHRGFTLLELMLAVAVVAVLAGVAMPIYQNQVKASRRSDARTALMNVAQLMERYFTERGTYATATLGTGGLFTTTSSAGYYTLSIVSQDANGFVLKATRAGAQSGDACGDLTIDQAGTRGVVNATSMTAAQCW